MRRTQSNMTGSDSYCIHTGMVEVGGGRGVGGTTCNTISPPPPSPLEYRQNHKSSRDDATHTHTPGMVTPHLWSSGERTKIHRGGVCVEETGGREGGR